MSAARSLVLVGLVAMPVVFLHPARADQSDRSRSTEKVPVVAAARLAWSPEPPTSPPESTSPPPSAEPVKSPSESPLEPPSPESARLPSESSLEPPAPDPSVSPPPAQPPPELDGATGPDDPEAALVAAAARDYDAGRFEEAAAKLEEGYRLYRKPYYLFNLGQVRRLAQDCAGAESAYRRYLAEAPPTDEHHALAAKHHAEMLACLPSTPPPVPVLAAADGPRPPPDPAELRTPARPLPSPAPPPPHAWMRATGLALVASGLLAAAGAVYFGLQARDRGDAASRAEYLSPAFSNAESEGKQAETLAFGLGIGAAVAGGAGVTLYFLAPRASAGGGRSSGATPMPLLVWAGRF